MAAALVAVVALIVLLFPAAGQSAHDHQMATVTTLWSATMTVGETGTSNNLQKGYVAATMGCLAPGATFTTDVTQGTNGAVIHLPDGELSLLVEPALTPVELTQWSLVIDAQEFHLIDATITEAVNQYSCSSAGLSWTDENDPTTTNVVENQVSLSLKETVQPNNPATGAPTVSRCPIEEYAEHVEPRSRRSPCLEDCEAH